MSKRIYLAGPMTGIPEFNYPAFHRAAKLWRKHGWTVLNPASDPDTSKPRAHYMRKDFASVLKVDAVAFLPGWHTSRGARAEHSMAVNLGLTLYDARWCECPLEPAPESIFEEAQRLIYGPRNVDYGHPRKDFAKTAKMMTGVLMPKLKDGVEVSAEDVALLMCCVKISREVNRPKRDNRVDICGYVGCLERLHEPKDEEAKP